MSLAESMTKKVGPLPMGVWLMVGAGGLAMAYMARQDGGETVTKEIQQVAVPVGGIAGVNAAPTYQTSFVRIPEIDDLISGLKDNTSALGGNTGAINTNTDVTKLTNKAIENATAALNKPAAPPAKPPAKPAAKPPAKPAAKPPAKPAAKPTAKTHKVKGGETLTHIALARGGAASKWKALYSLNKTTIETEAKRRGKKSSENGKWIFPGTVLKLPTGWK